MRCSCKMQRFCPGAQLHRDALPSSCRGVTHMCLLVTQCPFAPPLCCLITIARHGTRARGGRMGLPSFTPAFSEAGDPIGPPGKGGFCDPIWGESPGRGVQAALPVGFTTLPSSLSLARGQTPARPFPSSAQPPLTAFPQHPCLFGFDLCCGRKAIKALLLVQKERSAVCPWPL